MQQQKDEHFVGKVAQKAIVEKEDKVLLMRDTREVAKKWELPGGRLNFGEKPEVGLARELKEEMGVDFVVHEVVYLEQFFQISDSKDALMIAYRCSLKNPAEEFVVDEREVCGFGWFTHDEIKEMTLFPEYSNAVEHYFSVAK